jgi:hypothetical protein
MLEQVAVCGRKIRLDDIDHHREATGHQQCSRDNWCNCDTFALQSPAQRHHELKHSFLIFPHRTMRVGAVSAAVVQGVCGKCVRSVWYGLERGSRPHRLACVQSGDEAVGVGDVGWKIPAEKVLTHPRIPRDTQPVRVMPGCRLI